jgi:broad specificity phosphatase PhoE
MTRTSISRRRTSCVLALLVVLGLGVLASAPRAQAQEITTVLVVRHAEKEWEDGDPPLSEVGWQRAEDLLQLTEESGVSVLFGTQYMRTTQTLEPIAAHLDLEILTHDARDSEGLARRILSEHEGEVVLVSGHSNTVPEIVAALGAPEPDPIDDAEYDNLYVVSVSSAGGEPTVLHLHFGRPAD